MGRLPTTVSTGWTPTNGSVPFGEIQVRAVRGSGEPDGERGIGSPPDLPAVGGQDDQPTVLAAQDEVVVMDQTVVDVAEEHEVGQLRASTEQPVPHVMGVEALDPRLRAAGTRAAAVAAQQRPALRPGGAALAATVGEGFASLLQHDHGGGLAEHAARLRACDRRAALEVRASGRGVVGEHVGVDVDHDLASRRVPGPTVHGHTGFGKRAQRSDAGGDRLPGTARRPP